MKLFSRFFIFFMTICFCLLQMAQPIRVLADNGISLIDPQIMGTPEEDVSSTAGTGKKSKTGLWIGIAAGVAVVAGLIVFGMGGGGGDDGGGDSTPTTGSVGVSW